MKRNQLIAIWLGGAALAVVIYLIGTDKFLTTIAYWWDSAIWDLHNWLRGISGPVYNLIRAAAVAVFILFWVLGVLVMRTGRHAVAVMIVVTLIFLVLVGGPQHWLYPVSARDWLAGLVDALVGALIMTGRLNRGV